MPQGSSIVYIYNLYLVCHYLITVKNSQQSIPQSVQTLKCYYCFCVDTNSQVHLINASRKSHSRIVFVYFMYLNQIELIVNDKYYQPISEIFQVTSNTTKLVFMNICMQGKGQDMSDIDKTHWCTLTCVWSQVMTWCNEGVLVSKCLWSKCYC